MSDLVYMSLCTLEGSFWVGSWNCGWKRESKELLRVCAPVQEAYSPTCTLHRAREDNGEGRISQSMGPRDQKAVFGEPSPGSRTGASHGTFCTSRLGRPLQ